MDLRGGGGEQLRARCAQSAVAPPSTRGTACWSTVGSPAGSARRERDGDVAPGPQAARGERLDQQLARRADGDRGRQQSVWPGRASRRPRRTRRAGRAGRGAAARRPASARRDHRVGGGDRRRYRAEPQPLAAERSAEAGDVAGRQVDAVRADRLQAALADVDADHVGAAAVQRERRRQADVAEPDDGNARGDQRCCGRGRVGDRRESGRRGDRERLRFGHGGSSLDRCRGRLAPGLATWRLARRCAQDSRPEVDPAMGSEPQFRSAG